VAQHWQAEGDLKEAARHARRALEYAKNGPSELIASTARAVAHIDRNRERATLEWAVDTLTERQDRSEHLAALLIDLGDCHRRAGHYAEAVDALERARSLRTGDVAAVCLRLGILAKELGAYDWAAHWYARTEAIHAVTQVSVDDAADLQHHLARLALSQHRFREAEVHARQAIALRQQVASPQPADLALLAAAVDALNRD
jgi:tetratricopeptide (TPR) repeat protein